MTFTRTRGELVLSDDPARLDQDAVVELLRSTYWASERRPETIRATVAASRCFGVRADGAIGKSGPAAGPQLAFCRVVTDGLTFAWLCDVVVSAEARGAGIGTWMVGEVIRDLQASGIGRLMLRTLDAHGLYRQFGFTDLADPATVMEALQVRPQ
jgi:GNAT superfamily N-acetyltransferase